jgi:carboxymethylenebutenolidase
MCDQHTAEDNEGLSRREFGIGMGAASLAALLPSPAHAVTVTGRDVTIATSDGSCDAFYIAPTSGRHPGVLMWPDIMGLRPAFRQMARRLAESGYAVLVVNQFYRSTKSPFLQPGESYDQPAVQQRIKPFREALSTEGTVRDGIAFTTWLDKQARVDTRRGLAVTGYCMGGPMMMRTAAARADRVRAGASFHGGGLVGDAPDSPDKLVTRMKGGYLFAVAQNDDARAPTDKDKLRATFAAARVPAEIEVYPANHGWCPPDSRAYDQAAAERAWTRQLALFSTHLGRPA